MRILIPIAHVGHQLPLLFSLLILNQTAISAAPKNLTVATQSELDHSLRQLTPGTTIQIQPGRYRGGIHLKRVAGRPDAPIVIEAADSSRPPEFVGQATGFHLSACSHILLRHLTIRASSGNGINVDDGGDSINPPTGIALVGLTVQDVGPKGNRDGIKLSGINQFEVRDCKVERWGDSGSAIDMVGCHEGLIKNCQFRHRSEIPANGVQTKGGSSDITIADCYFYDAGSRALNIGGSTGRDYFRPRDADYEAKRVRVTDCIIVGSDAAVAFVGVDQATFKHNTVFLPKRWIIRILQESTGQEMVPCGNVTIADNLIIFREDQIRSHLNLGAGTAPETFQFERNLWYCEDHPANSKPRGMPVQEVDGSYDHRPLIENAAGQDMRLIKIIGKATPPNPLPGARTLYREHESPTGSEGSLPTEISIPSDEKSDVQ